MWLEVVAREASQREIADRWGVDRSTVIKIAQVAKLAALDGLATLRTRTPGQVTGRPGARSRQEPRSSGCGRR